MSGPYEVRFTPGAKRALSRDLPEKVATAAYEFIMGALAQNPRRVGRQLRGPLHPLYAARRGEYRIVYRIDEDRIVINVVSIAHRRDAYHR